MNLVGIPWEEADCLALAVMAQKELWGKVIHLDMPIGWTDETLKERSHEIEKHIARFADPLDEPEEGAVGVIHVGGYCHLVTFLSPYRILHVVEGGRSYSSRYSPAIQRRIISIWRIRR